MKKILSKVALIILCLAVVPACAVSRKQRMMVNFTNGSNQTVYLEDRYSDFMQKVDRRMEEAARESQKTQVAGDRAPIIAQRTCERGRGQEASAGEGVVAGASIGNSGATMDGKRRRVIVLPAVKGGEREFFTVRPGQTISYQMGDYSWNETYKQWGGSFYTGLGLHLTKETIPEVPNRFPSGWYRWFYKDDLPPPTQAREIPMGTAVWDGKTVRFSRVGGR